MISLLVTGHAEPEQSREEIARLLKEYGVGAVCLLRNGFITGVQPVKRGFPPFVGVIGYYPYMSEQGENYNNLDGTYSSIDGFVEPDRDIIRVFPPGTRLRVTVEVVE